MNNVDLSWIRFYTFITAMNDLFDEAEMECISDDAMLLTIGAMPLDRERLYSVSALMQFFDEYPDIYINAARKVIKCIAIVSYS